MPSRRRTRPKTAGFREETSSHTPRELARSQRSTAGARVREPSPGLPSPSARLRAFRRSPPHRARPCRARRARSPSRSSPTRLAPWRGLRLRSSCTMAVTWWASRDDASGARSRTIASFFLERRVFDPLIEASALERVVHFARAVRREDDERGLDGPHGPELGNGDLKFREQLEEKSFELFVGAIDFVDQQNGRTCTPGIDGLEQRTLDEKRLAVEIAPRGFPIERAASPRECAAPGADARSPTRTGRGRRRGPRNTGGG